MRQLVPLRFEIESKNIATSTLQLSLIGFFDEKVRLDPEIVPSNVKTLIFDFDELILINSFGIKLWVNFTSALSERSDLAIEFQNCRKQVIASINTVEGFIPKNAEVKSFYVPIHCNKCDQSFESLKKASDIDIHSFSIEKDITNIACANTAECKNSLEMDFNPSQFFRFLKRVS